MATTEYWRHKKSGGLYRIVMECTIEATATPAYAYRSEATGIVWVRPIAEFLDGRFEKEPLLSEAIIRRQRDEWPDHQSAEPSPKLP